MAEVADQSERTVAASHDRWCLKACVVMLVVACLIGSVVAIAAASGLWWLVRSSRTSLEVDLSYPAQVDLGDTLDLTVTLQNVEDKPQASGA